MSKITTRSIFFYGTRITRDNYTLDFSEDGGATEILADLPVKDYSPSELVAEIQNQLRINGSQLYVVSLDRPTRKITISAPLDFVILASTGSRVDLTAWNLIGYDADTIDDDSHLAPENYGLAYETQYPVDRYASAEHSIERESAQWNVTPIGLGQLVSFGDGKRISLNIRLITNQNIQSSRFPDFKYDSAGIANFMSFMDYMMDKCRIEFSPDVDDPDSFEKVFLNSTPEDRDAASFKLKNMGTPNFYESGPLTFRKVLV